MNELMGTTTHLAAALLLLGNALVFVGVMMFWIRHGEKGGLPRTRAYFVWERTFIMAGILPTAAGFLLLQGQFADSFTNLLARAGAGLYVVGGLVGVTAETLGVAGKYRYQYPLIALYVVLAFLAQAVIGAALLQSGLVAAWIGWAAIIWNIVWLVVLPLLTPRDVYFPVLHHFVPLLVGLAFLLK